MGTGKGTFGDLEGYNSGLGKPKEYARHLGSCNIMVSSDVCNSLRYFKPQQIFSKPKNFNPFLEFWSLELNTFKSLDSEALNVERLEEFECLNHS